MTATATSCSTTWSRTPGSAWATTRASASCTATEPPRALDPAVRQLLTPARNAARTEGVLPAAFDAEAACDLDQDGFADLVVTTDPPFNGTGRPPVPLQILFGSPNGLTGKAVRLRIPDRAFSTAVFSTGRR